VARNVGALEEGEKVGFVEAQEIVVQEKKIPVLVRARVFPVPDVL
jgi:hypothetical protein